MCSTTRRPGAWAIGAAQRWWLHHSLAALARDLEAAGAPLVLRRGRAAEEVARLAERDRRDASPCARPLRAVVAGGRRGRWPSSSISCLHDGAAARRRRDRIRTAQGGPLPHLHALLARVASTRCRRRPAAASARAIERRRHARRQRPPRRLAPAPDQARLGERVRRLDAGRGRRARARRRVRRARSRTMTVDRNLPSIDGSSRLSPHLHFGEVSPARRLARGARGRRRCHALPARDRLARLHRQPDRPDSPTLATPTAARRSTGSRGAAATTPTPTSPPGRGARPAIRSSMPGCASSGRPAGCTIACG